MFISKPHVCMKIKIKVWCSFFVYFENTASFETVLMASSPQKKCRMKLWPHAYTLKHRLQYLTGKCFHSSECSKNYVNCIVIYMSISDNGVDRMFRVSRWMETFTSCFSIYALRCIFTVYSWRQFENAIYETCYVIQLLGVCFAIVVRQLSGPPSPPLKLQTSNTL